MSARRLLLIATLALAAFLSRSLWLGSGEPEALRRSVSRAPTGNEENPDGERLLDLAKLPFRPD
ncbi:MAG TPA: hypothetical protein PKA37_08975, partial [Planctomycetota bacterium]|nr:hypothetical protein [Planctomycetota bacterium]